MLLHLVTLPALRLVSTVLRPLMLSCTLMPACSSTKASASSASKCSCLSAALLRLNFCVKTAQASPEASRGRAALLQGAGASVETRVTGDAPTGPLVVCPWRSARYCLGNPMEPAARHVNKDLFGD